jgi:AcrR family transcriptional regulator
MPSDRIPEPTRRERKKARTRREIFRAAMGLFGERGFEAVTVEQVCAAADVAKGTFFAHFPSKAALLEAWSAELAAELGAALRDHTGTSLAQLRLLADRLGDHWLRRPEATRALLRGLLTGVARDEPLRDLVAAIVVRGQERGELRRNVSAPVAAEILLASCAAVYARTPYGRDHPAPEQTEQMRNELLHALLHGLHEPKPRVRWRSDP